MTTKKTKKKASKKTAKRSDRSIKQQTWVEPAVAKAIAAWGRAKKFKGTPSALLR